MNEYDELIAWFGRATHLHRPLRIMINHTVNDPNRFLSVCQHRYTNGDADDRQFALMLLRAYRTAVQQMKQPGDFFASFQA